MFPQPARTSLRSRVLVYHKDKEGVLHSLQNFDFLEKILDAVSRGANPRKPRVITTADRERMNEIGLSIVRPTELDIVIEYPWDPRTFINIVAKANDKGLRRRVHMCKLLNQVIRMLYDRGCWRLICCVHPEACCVRHVKFNLLLVI